MKDKVFVRNGKSEGMNRSCYIPPNHVNHPYKDVTYFGLNKLRAKLRLLPTVNDHIIIVSPKSKYSPSKIEIRLKYSSLHKETALLALDKLKRLKEKNYKPPRRAILIHEKVHYQEELRSQNASLFHDVVILIQYLNRINSRETTQLRSLGIQARMLTEIESITSEMKQINSPEYVIVKLCSLLEEITGSDYQSQLSKYFQQLATKHSIADVSPHFLGNIYILMKDKRGFINLLTSNKFSLKPEEVENLERYVVGRISNYLQHPKQYMYDLSNEEIDLKQIQNQIQRLATEVRAEILRLIFEKKIPTHVLKETILFKNTHPV
ncbi:hypothetical protein KA017_01080 [Candidatus Woesebacteria bacterium]|nr:hypothetical protein [Candidatus Woesebacteria bacterium]